MDRETLKGILEQHELWINSSFKKGTRADLSGANLCEADLREANLYRADLYGADLREANLSAAIFYGANLSAAIFYGANLFAANFYGANLREANLYRADLYRANLFAANFYGANLREANLYRADLRGANLCKADLREANFYGADLREAKLSAANFYGANLREANLYRADLYRTNLCEVDLRGADLRGATNVPFIPMSCPDSGSFIGWKKASAYIVKLLIPEDARRSSSTGRKCRTDKATVLAIENIDGSISELKEVHSTRDSNFIYRIGETVTVGNFDENRFAECAPGIHFFINRQEAVEY